MHKKTIVPKACNVCFSYMCFPVNFAKFLRILFLQNTSGRVLVLLWSEVILVIVNRSNYEISLSDCKNLNTSTFFSNKSVSAMYLAALSGLNFKTSLLILSFKLLNSSESGKVTVSFGFRPLSVSVKCFFHHIKYFSSTGSAWFTMGYHCFFPFLFVLFTSVML